MFLIHSRHRSRPRVTRPQLEALEERLVLNNRFVVPVGVPVDNATTFASLTRALTSAGLNAGDIIQIEPGATPGNVSNGNVPALANLTIQGDPAAALVSIPQFTVSDPTSFPVANAGFILKNVNIGLIATGSLQFFSSATITGSSLVDLNSTARFGINFTPGTANNVANAITNSTLSSVGVGQNDLVDITPSSGTGNSNVFANNTFVSSSISSGGVLLAITSVGNVTLSGSMDKVLGNTFLGAVGSQLNSMFFNSATTTGLTVQGNTFSDPDTGVYAIGLSGDTVSGSGKQTVVVIGNTINLTGANAIGIGVEGGNTSQVFADLFNNQIASRNGSGLHINGTNALGVVMVRAQANDFHGSKIAVLVDVNASSGGNLKVDLGGAPGPTFGGSLGANNFRDLGAANANQGSILVTGTNPTIPLTLFAQKDIFSNTPPISFLSPGLSNVTADTSNALSANAAFVETLYVNFLKRTGDTSNAADAGFWVTALTNNTMTPVQVANALIHSAEGLGILVDGLYQKLLNRASDTAGRGFFVNLMQHGTTVEQVVTLLVTSSEYAALTGSDSGYVQSLYVKLLGRIGSNAEVAFWLGQLPTAGRAAVVNAILASAEFRADVVQELYGFSLAPAVSVASVFAPLLHRTAGPTAGDVNFWVNGTQDLLALATAFAQTGEFFGNG